MRYMLDTNICIHISRRRPEKVLARFEQLEQGDAAMSLVTYGELRFGAVKSDNADEALRRLEQTANIIPVLPLDLSVCSHYATLRKKLQAQGLTIGSNDFWIAAHCLSLGLTMVTNNVREFERIPDLLIENWTS